MFRNFDELMDTIKSKKQKLSCAVVSANSEAVLSTVLKAYKDGIIEPLLIGDESAIRECREKIGEKAESIRMIPTRSPEESAQKAVELAKSGEVEILMKGNINTSVLFGTLLDKKNGLQPKKILAGFGIFEIPGYHKLLAATDGGITLYPTLEEKKHLIENAVAALRRIGVSCPKVAALAALEVATPKMPETMDAAALKKMNERGEVENCIIEGPISYDLAIDKESAQIKGFDSPVAGDADLLLYPDITSGNLTGKALVFSASARVAMFVIGAEPVIVAGSRASKQEDYYRSLVIASAMGRKRSQGKTA